MTPEQAAAALGERTKKRGRHVTLTPEERRRRVLARSAAQSAAKTALSHLHQDDYDALYRAALKRELSA